jgi:hypothetical protein
VQHDRLTGQRSWYGSRTHHLPFDGIVASWARWELLSPRQANYTNVLIHSFILPRPLTIVAGPWHHASSSRHQLGFRRMYGGPPPGLPVNHAESARRSVVLPSCYGLSHRSISEYSFPEMKPDLSLGSGRTDLQSPRSRANTRRLLAGMVMCPEYGMSFAGGPLASIPPGLPWTAGLGK